MSKPCNITCARLDLIYVSTTMLALNNDWALGYPSAEPVAFSYARPRKSRYQTVVSKVKIALLPDPESYGYAHSLLVHASDTFRLSSVQQIPEDFLRFAVAHATKECRDLLEKRTQIYRDRKEYLRAIQRARRIERPFEDVTRVQPMSCTAVIIPTRFEDSSVPARPFV